MINAGRRYHTLGDKFRIVEAALALPRNVRATARNFGVDHKQVQRWTELYYSLTAEKREQLKGKQTVNTGRRAFEADLEEALYVWGQLTNGVISPSYTVT